MTRRRLTRWLALPAGIVVTLAAVGFAYETIASRRDARAFPPAGTLVDVGGHRLHLVCNGEGLPIVVFEAAGFSNALGATAVRERVARETRVCSYDRRGVGWSDPAPSSLSVGQLVDDLRRLQDAAQLRPPYIVVTASIGGLVTELFARRYPERVAALLFLDAAIGDMVPRALPMFSQTQTRALCAALGAAGRVGVMRALDPFHIGRSSDADARSFALMYGAQQWRALCAILRGADATAEEFANAPAMKTDVPLIVLSAETTDGLAPPGFGRWTSAAQAALGEGHRELARRSTRGSWRIVPGSGHLIAASDPEVVSETVLDLVRQVRDEP